MRHLFYFAFLFTLCASKIYKKCELAVDLKYKYGLPMEEVKNWVCIAEFESTFNTEAVNQFNWDGSKDFGLWQLNNRYWCGSDHGANVCNIPCEALLDEDLTDDLACAHRVIRDTKKWMNTDDGYIAWVAYTRECKDRNLDDYIAECSEELSTPPSTVASPPTSPATSSEKQPEEMVETSSTPPRASGVEAPRKPPTRVSEESSIDSESFPPAVSDLIPTSSNVEVSDSQDEITTQISISPPITVSPIDQTTSNPPSRASGLGSSILPTDTLESIVNSDTTTNNNNNAISLENIPFISSGLGDTLNVNEATPQNDVSKVEAGVQEESHANVEDDIELKQELENILKNFNANPFLDNLGEFQNFGSSEYSDELFPPHYQEPSSDLDLLNRYSIEPISYHDLPLIQHQDNNKQVPTFESRLPDYDVFSFNPNYQDTIRSDILNTYQPYEENKETQNAYDIRYPEASELYMREFEPKNAFGYIFPVSSPHVSRIFKPFPFFNIHKPDTTQDTTKQSGFNFVKLVPELDFQPIDINIKKLIKPVKIPIPYPNINFVKETVEGVNIKDFIKPISKPQFNVQPVQVGFKRIVKPVLVPTIVKKQVEIPKLSLKQVGIPFIKPSFEKEAKAKERTFMDYAYDY